MLIFFLTQSNHYYALLSVISFLLYINRNVFNFIYEASSESKEHFEMTSSAKYWQWQGPHMVTFVSFLVSVQAEFYAERSHILFLSMF